MAVFTPCRTTPAADIFLEYKILLTGSESFAGPLPAIGRFASISD
jgi:hypothetical protein